jgi:hypothetical protein
MYDTIPELARYPASYAAADTRFIYDAVEPVIHQS